MPAGKIHVYDPPDPGSTGARLSSQSFTIGGHMSVAKVIEISAESPQSFEAAIKEGVARASKTVKQIQSAWVKEQEVKIRDNQIVAYRVFLKITFILED
jgi:flavin-binding protein dodecin